MDDRDSRNRIEELIQESITNPQMDVRYAMIDALVDAVNRDEGLYVKGVRTDAVDDENWDLTITMSADDHGNRYLPVYTDWNAVFGSDKAEASFGSGEEDAAFDGDREEADHTEGRKIYLDFLLKYVLEQSDLAGIEINPNGNRCRLSRGLLWRVFEEREAKENDQDFYNRMIRRAIKFAREFYPLEKTGEDGDFTFSYLDRMHILNDMNMAVVNPAVMIAGILYRILEQTDATLEMIRWQFGDRVARLIGEHLRHLELDEEARKQQFISDLEKADTEVKILALADTLALQRRILRDSRVYPGKVWNPDDEEQRAYVRYLSGIQDSLYDLQFDDAAKYAYWELVDTFKDLFVEFFYDRENEQMYQVCTGETYMIARSNLQAVRCSDPLPENAVKVPRKYAERIERQMSIFDWDSKLSIGLQKSDNDKKQYKNRMK